MDIAERKTTDIVTLSLSGRLDTTSAKAFEDRILAHIESGGRRIAIDLAGLEYISSAGLRVFSATRKTLQARGGQTSFVHMQPQIQEVFEIMKSLPGVAVFENVAELDRYLAARQRSHTDNQ
jgi:sigma-B regulation protein RsbU (phosphoserine phosphatase)